MNDAAAAAMRQAMPRPIVTVHINESQWIELLERSTVDEAADFQRMVAAAVIIVAP